MKKCMDEKMYKDIEENSNTVNWFLVCRKFELTENFIREFQDYVD